MAFGLFVILGMVFLLTPSRKKYRAPLPADISWLAKQTDLKPFVQPDQDTHVLQPKSQCIDCTFLSIIVCSAVPNFEARRAIRNSWAREVAGLPGVPVHFLMGKSTEDSLNAEVANESRKHADIIQEDFLDTYQNLTLESVMLLKWVNRHCANAKYVMKIDDDVFLNIPNLFRILKIEGHKNKLFGRLVRDAYPNRKWNSKFFVPQGAFSGEVYPPYLYGMTYLMSGDTVPLLYRTALNTPFFHMEDVFLTGVCASRAGLEHMDYMGFSNWVRKGISDPCVFKSCITAHSMKPNDLLHIWNALQNPSLKCTAKS